MVKDFEKGLLVGVLIGEGHFGGDGKQPHLTLRMHTRHEALFKWLTELFPRTRVYGPYNHGGRSYLQWMARGTALAEDVLPVLASAMDPGFDSYAWQRYLAMLERYRAVLERRGAPASVFDSLDR